MKLHLLLLLGLFTPLAWGGPWYVGAEAVRLRVKFTPDYTYTDGSPNDRFKDPARGEGLGVLLGRGFEPCAHFRFALQARVMANNAAWELTTGEPAALKYTMPLAGALSVLPEWRVSERLAVFGEVGLGWARFDQRKTTPTPATVSSYDITQWSGGLVAGFGVRYALSPRVAVQAVVRHTDYQSYRFVSRLADGSVPEVITESPSSNEFTVGVTVPW